MRKDAHFSMAAPAPGFSARVMERIAAHERRQAQWRALLGSALLVAFAGTILVIVALWLSAWVVVVVREPHIVVGLIGVVGSIFFWLNTLINALGMVLAVIEENIDPLQMTLYAAGVLALTLLWTRAVTGSFQLALTNPNLVGGFRK